jgi:hypothetical protein
MDGDGFPVKPLPGRHWGDFLGDVSKFWGVKFDGVPIGNAI